MSIAAIIAAAFGAAIAIILAVAAARALSGGAGPRARAAGPQSLPEARLAEAAGVEDALAVIIRRPTVSRFESSEEDGTQFAALAADLQRLFPRVHAQLEREEVGDRALLYTWRGSDPAKPPAILCAHYDVVPAQDAPLWKRPPFSGDIADGFVWGRGAQDIKLTLASILDAAERLLAEGFVPSRTLYFAFGGDEETGGLRGAAAMGELLARRGVRASFILDEGGPVAQGMLSFVDRPVALVAVAEKGYMDLLLEAAGSGGHASMPPRRSASGDIARAVAAVEKRREKARLTGTLRAMLEGLSEHCGFAYRLLFRNLWLTAPLVKAAFSASNSTNALIRTTAAPTMLRGSDKENVLADRALAVLNVRILPGDSSAAVIERITRKVSRFGVDARPAHAAAVVEPSPESPTAHEGYRAITAALAQAFPEACAVPFLLSGGTDTKHYLPVAGAVYRMTPAFQTDEDLKAIHGRDERIAVANLHRCAIFYKALMRGL